MIRQASTCVIERASKTYVSEGVSKSVREGVRE